MRKKILPILMALVAALSLTACSEAPVMPELQTSRSVPEKPAVGENYYGNINYDYLSQGQIPYGKNGYGTMDNINDEMEAYVSDLIDRCVKSEPASGSFEEMVKEIYLQYTDVDARNQAGADALMQFVVMVEQCSTIDELVSVMGYLYQNCGVSSFFRPEVRPNGYDTSMNLLYLMNMNTLGNMKENFTKTDAGPENMGQMVRDTLVAIQVAPDEAKQRAKNTVKLINEIMLATMDSDDILDMEKHLRMYDRSSFKELFSHIDTENMLASFGYSVDQLILYDEGQAKKINELLTGEHIRAIKDYLMTCIMFDYSEILPPAYSEALSSVSDLEKDPDKAAKQFIAIMLEQELSVLYSREICTDEVMNMVTKMVADIQTSCRDLIHRCERLSEDSKNKYLRKLDNMVVLLGYDMEMTPLFTITPAKQGGNLIENVIAIKQGRVQHTRNSINQAPDRSAWSMSAIEVNATYYPMSNTFAVPAVMMSKACVDPAANEYYNLGMLGYVIAHELNHAFDSDGFQFDEYGNFKPDWINAEDQEKYYQLMERVTDYYNHVKLLDMYSINGKMTLSENLADLGAVQCLLNVTTDKENQRQIFTGIAEQWASLTLVTDLLMQINGDVHSPGEARVNAVVATMDAFYEVYDIKETDKMYIAPENRVKVW